MLVSQQTILPHERIGRYEVLRKIATGGMAELFLAKQVGMEGFEKVVAIKRILAHLAFDDEFINMFRDEARIVAKLSHPNIVQIYDLGKSDDTYFIAMEYIPGRNLSSVAKKAKAKGVPLPPEYIARCIAQACEGLYYAHTRQDIDGKPLKIVHRDVSPQNIILAFSGGVKLVDFGIAKAATKIAHTRAGVLKGKYAYMSPEQIRGDEVDARSDLFAVGIVLYELLCGRRPFEKENSIQTLKAIVQEAHVDCRTLNRDIPDGLAAIIDKALTKNNVDRWSSAQELQLALEDFVANTGKRCNNIAISRWVTELFSEELSRDRGGTMVFKGVGEIILPDLEERAENAEKAREALIEAAPLERPDRHASQEPRLPAGSDDPAGMALVRGRGGGSISPRPPIPAPSVALEERAKEMAADSEGVARKGPTSSSNAGREGLIEEGIIERRSGGRPRRRSSSDAAAEDGGWNDDKTALADDEGRSVDIEIAAEPSVISATEEPIVVDPPKSPFDDSKTEFGTGSLEGPEPSVSREVAFEPGGDQTWVPEEAEEGDAAAARLSGSERDPSARSGVEIFDREDVEDVSLEAEPIGAGDPWDEATVGYPDGLPAGLESPAAIAPNRHDAPPTSTGEVDTFLPANLESFQAPPASAEDPDESLPGGPDGRELPRRSTPARLRSSPKDHPRSLDSEWEGLASDEISVDSNTSHDGDLWDDKTTTNDAYQAEEAIRAPEVHAVPGRSARIGDTKATVHSPHEVESTGLDSRTGLSSKERDDPVTGERTLESVDGDDANLDLSDSTGTSSLTEEGPLSDDIIQARAARDDGPFQDATVLGGPGGDAAAEDTGATLGLPGDDETARSLDHELILPRARAGTASELDARTLAGVTSDNAPGPPSKDRAASSRSSAHDDAGVEIALGGGEEDPAPREMSPARPKPKRGGRGLGAIKLARIPAAGEPHKERSQASFDSSEDRTESGAAKDSPLPSLPKAIDLGDAAEETPLAASTRSFEDTADGVVSAPAGKSTARADAGAASQAPRLASPGGSEDATEEKPAEVALFDPPPSLGVRAPALSLGPKVPAPLHLPPALGTPSSAGAPSLSDFLAVPPNASSRPGVIQAAGRSGGNGLGPLGGLASVNPSAAQGPPPALGPPPVRSLAGRQIREVVRGTNPPQIVSNSAPSSMPPPFPLENAPPSDAEAIIEGPLLDSTSPPVALPSAFAGVRRPSRLLLTAGLVLSILALSALVFLLVPEIFSKEPQLTIKTMPDGADIYLNGQIQPAKTPATLEGLHPGSTYELRLVKEGFETVTKTVPIPKNTRYTLVIPLRPLDGAP